MSVGDSSTVATCPYTVIRQPDVVREVLHRPGDFSPANALLAVTPLQGQALRVLQRAGFALPAVLASNASPTHAGIRKVVTSFFTPAKVAAAEPRIRQLARESALAAAARLRSEGSVELVQSVAAHPPAIVMLELLGLPVRDLDRLKAWSVESLELFWGWPDPGRQLELAHSAADFYTWLRGMVLESVAPASPATASAGPTNLFRALADHGLSTAEICSLGYFLLIAGQETTSQLISTTLFRLAEGSRGITWDEAASLAKSRELVRHILATESSVPSWRRVAARDTEIQGKAVAAGEELLLELTGNHGFPWADGVPTPYGLAFGSGIHRCLGAKLAELEAAVVVHQTASALKGIELKDPQPEWLRLLSFQAPGTVTVRRRQQ
ncbi:cytochrome P450 [Paenarthrobacter ureafaciens]|uniref:cytochrome P450 n=1 Tax=Paenarthrobacter ureafaciens TaxID=37931 RepID=UPI0014093BEB|nr:cytochrome P450 [Paenarthrobacter ureafaciens]MCX8456525.1 cytochrome P450 [Paenarthrobacter ureafaciens]MCY0972337.1 cytochrome P450 [Paenarthrobacter ureafaciens]